MRTALERAHVGNREHRTIEVDQTTVLEGAEGAGNGFAGCADELADLLVGEEEAETCSVLGGLAVFAHVQQQAGKFLRSGGREADRTQLVAGHGVLQANFFRNQPIDFRMAAEKVAELGSLRCG